MNVIVCCNKLTVACVCECVTVLSNTYRNDSNVIFDLISVSGLSMNVYAYSVRVCVSVVRVCVCMGERECVCV